VVPVMFSRLGVRVGGHDAALVAAGELADQRNVHAADEADRAGLGCLGGHHADEVGAFLLLVDHRTDVRLVDDHVDDREIGVGILGGDFSSAAAQEKPAMTIGLLPSLGEAAQRLLALGCRWRFRNPGTRCRSRS
jgi:hypothetical protein